MITLEIHFFWELLRGKEKFKKIFFLKTAWPILLNKIYVVEINKAIPEKKFLKKLKIIIAKIFFWIFFEFFFWGFYSGVATYIFYVNFPYNILHNIYLYRIFWRGGTMWKKNKNRACNTSHRYGALLPIAYLGNQLYCIFSWSETLLKIKIAL